MWGGVATILFFAAAMSAPIGPVTVSASALRGQCQITGGDKLPDALRQSICGQVQRAISVKAPRAHYAVNIRVLSPARLSAELVVHGHVLPTQNFAVMDQNLTPVAIEHFADSLATAVAKATKS